MMSQDQTVAQAQAAILGRRWRSRDPLFQCDPRRRRWAVRQESSYLRWMNVFCGTRQREVVGSMVMAFSTRTRRAMQAARQIKVKIERSKLA